MAPTAARHDDEIFGLRMDRSAADLWPMLDELYGNEPGYARFRADLDACLRRNWARKSCRTTAPWV